MNADNIKQVLSIDSDIAVQRTVAQIYRLVNDSSLYEFQRTVLQIIRPWCAFDMAYWQSDGNNKKDEWFQFSKLTQSYYFKTPQNKLVSSVHSEETKNSRQARLLPGLEPKASVRFGIYGSTGQKYVMLKAGYKSIDLQLLLFVEKNPAQPNLSEPPDKRIWVFITENIVRALYLLLKQKVNQTWFLKDSYKEIYSKSGQLLNTNRSRSSIARHGCNDWPSIVEELYASNSPHKFIKSTEHFTYFWKMESLCFVEVLPRNEFNNLLICLTPVEKHICYQLTEGLCAQQIANANDVSIKTVDNHIQSIHKKLGFSRNSELISWLLSSGYNFEYFING